MPEEQGQTCLMTNKKVSAKRQQCIPLADTLYYIMRELQADRDSGTVVGDSLRRVIR